MTQRPRFRPTTILHLTPPHDLLYLPSTITHRWQLFAAHTRLPSGLLVRSLLGSETRILPNTQSVIACKASDAWRNLWGDLQLDALWLPTTGVSMQPFLQTGDQVAVIPHAWRDIRIGQIIVFAVEQRWIIHRVTSLSPQPPSMLRRVAETWGGAFHIAPPINPNHPQTPLCWTRGDNRSELDRPLQPHQLLGLVTQAKRNDKPLPIDTFTQRAHNALRDTKRLLSRFRSPT